jgi:hypothetical protein
LESQDAGRSYDIDKGDSSDSDMGLPPPLPLKLNNRTTFMPKLAIGNLGLSTLAKNEGGKTAEEMADAEILD